MKIFGFEYDPKKINSASVLQGLDIGYGKNQYADISPVKEIYKLEYITSILKQKIDNEKLLGKDVSIKTRVYFSDLQKKLEKLIDNENNRLAFAMHLWLNFDITGSSVRIAEKKLASVLTVVGDLNSLKEELINTGKLPNGVKIDPYIFVGIELPDGKKITKRHVDVLEKNGTLNNVWFWAKRMSPDAANKKIEKYITETYLKPAFKEMLENFKAAIEFVKKAITLDEKIIAFHVALSTVHCGGTIANNVYGHDAVNQLTDLSNKHTNVWDLEIANIMRGKIME